jgi:uncharacterized membrane protein YgcG
MADLTDAGIRNHFYKGFNEPVLKQIFHIVGIDVDLGEIFHSAACGLYCTLFANMCAYILKHCVKPGLDERTMQGMKHVFRAFRDCAKEKTFQQITVDDLPLQIRKPANAKRIQLSNELPLSQRDSGFRVFGPPPGFTPRPPRMLQQSLGPGNDGGDGNGGDGNGGNGGDGNGGNGGDGNDGNGGSVPAS